MSDLENLLSGLLSGQNSSSDNDNSGQQAGAADTNGEPDIGIDIEKLLQLGEMLSKLNQPDKNTELLLALKPHLRTENQAKIDTAVKLLRLASLLPYLKDSGIFDNLF